MEKRNLDQIAALPLGGRIHVACWTDSAQLEKTAKLPLISPREKMPFEVTPVYPYITRFAADDATKAKVAANSTTGGK